STTAQHLGLANTPSPEVQARLAELVTYVLDPLRQALGRPVRITSVVPPVSWTSAGRWCTKGPTGCRRGRLERQGVDEKWEDTMSKARSKIHPKYKTRYRVRNWADYDRALVSRGDLTLWFSPRALAAWKPLKNGLRGGQRRYSDVVIETALTLRLVFGLPWRQTEGLLASILVLMGVELDTPDHTTLSRRARALDVQLQRVPATGPVHLIVDATGLGIVGQGEWAAAKWGSRGRRGWRKLHLGVDEVGR
ncbi:MAG: IS5 family transposase, partial [Actinomycetia bacterium]|nr:IS5 family transposase [Actinomycetes bacterium]